ncbi:MAG TPA: DUF3786 domain-containing protein [Patescibacteria group bacterium]|nr:DUF3786 domain-containing protein [Patescibacteria group bacterium]
MQKSWEELRGLSARKTATVKFLADEYQADLEKEKVFSLSCNVLAKDFTAILVIHYLIQASRGLPELSGEWVSFKELSGIEGYYAAFRKRSIEPVLRKYGKDPEAMLSVLERLPGRKASEGDVGVIIEAFPSVPAMVLLWKADEEFGPEASILFDRSISRVFCTEDIVVLAGMVASAL